MIVPTAKTVLDHIMNDCQSRQPNFSGRVYMDEPKRAERVVRTYGKGEVIFEEGRPGQEMYVIATGAVKITTLKKGRVTLLNRLEVGEFFGEMALVDGAPRSGTATADMEGTSILAFDRSKFLSRVKQEPEFALNIMRTLCERIRRRDSLYLELIEKTGEGKEFPEVLASLLDEILRIIPSADVVQIRLLECPLPGMERRLVPGLEIKRTPQGSLIAPIFTDEPEVAVRRLSDCVVGYAAETRQIQFIADLFLPVKSQPAESKGAKKSFDVFRDEVKRKAEDAHIYNHELWRKYLENDLSKIATEIAAPLIAGDALLGVISILAHKANVFTPRDLGNLEFIAEKAVLDILQAKTQLISKVGRLAEKIAGHFDLDALGNALAEEVKSCIPGSLVDLYRCKYDAAIRNWKFQRITFSGASRDERELWKHAPRSKGGIGLEAIRKRCFVFEEHVDDTTNKRASSNARIAKVKSTGCLPLLFGQDVVGVLYIHSKTRHYFSLHEKDALDLLVSLAAVAIHNVSDIGKHLPTYEDLFGDCLEHVFNMAASGDSPHDEVDTITNAMNNIISRNFFEAIKKVRGLTDMNNCVTNTVTALAALLEMPDDFMKKFVTLAGDESFLQRLSNYRDHYLHSFHVFLLGYMRHLTWWRMGMNGIVPKTKVMVRRWFTSAIFHDVAYAVERSDDALEDFFKNSLSEGVSCQINMSPLISSPRTKIIEHYETLKNELSRDGQKQADFVRWLFKHLIKTKSHGILAAVILLNLNWKEEDRASFAPRAALDIILHNYHDSPEEGWKMSFNKFPQAGLLTYCDEIQERDYYSTINAGKTGFVRISSLIYERNSMTCKLHYDGKQTDFDKVCTELNQKAENVKKGWEETPTSGSQAFYLQGDMEKKGEALFTNQYLLIG